MRDDTATGIFVGKLGKDAEREIVMIPDRRCPDPDRPKRRGQVSPSASIILACAKCIAAYQGNA